MFHQGPVDYILIIHGAVMFYRTNFYAHDMTAYMSYSCTPFSLRIQKLK